MLEYAHLMKYLRGLQLPMSEGMLEYVTDMPFKKVPQLLLKDIGVEKDVVLRLGRLRNLGAHHRLLHVNVSDMTHESRKDLTCPDLDEFVDVEGELKLMQSSIQLFKLPGELLLSATLKLCMPLIILETDHGGVR